MIQTTTRNATMGDLAALLQDQHARKLDVIAPASAITARDGNIVIRGTEPVLTADGVTTGDGTYVPTSVADEGIASKLDVPLAYLRRMRNDRPDLYDANVNGWLHGVKPKMRRNADGSSEAISEGTPTDPRSFMLRTFRGDNPGDIGIARAFLSDKYAVMDHLDCLTAAMDGVTKAGVNVQIAGCDLSDRRMVVKIVAPEIQALAPTLLAGYRSPFTGASGTDNPTVFAGFQISNSEVGGGAFSIVPRMVFEVCSNGMTRTIDAVKAVHLGGRQDDGIIRWSEDTERKGLELITARTIDAVRTFLDVDYMTHVIEQWSAKAEEPISKVEEVTTLVKSLRFSQEVIDGVLAQFIQGGQMTVGGVVNAVTAHAQTVDSADVAYELEARATNLLAV